MRKITEAKPLNIETIYRFYIEWDHPEKVPEITGRIEKLKRPASVESTNYGCGPCWNAYHVIQGPDRRDVEAYAAKVVRLLRRYKDIHIEE